MCATIAKKKGACVADGMQGFPVLFEGVQLLRNRLANENISTVDSDWCAEEDLGWSERILRRKLKSSGLDINHINAPVRSPQGATILRPPSFPLCEPLAPAFTSGYAVIPKSHVPILAC